MDEETPDKSPLEQIHEICEEFVSEWRAGRRPSLSDYLAKVATPLRDELFVELLSEELHERRQAGESPTLDEYLVRFPDAGPLLAQAFSTVATGDAEASTHSLLESTRDFVGTPVASSADVESPRAVRARGTTGGFPREFGEYVLESEIARGGMGVVYRAHQRSLNRVVALKMILGGEGASPEIVRRFQAEARAAAGLDHPGIVPVYDVGRHRGQHFFSMGLVEGSTLAIRLREGPLPAETAAAMLREIAEAVDYAHGRGVIHRDLKPGNILLDSQGRPRVSDFGLAKRLEAGAEVTGSGFVMGTPAYMPPEQAAGQSGEVGPRADLYSLGAILYAMLTGRPPFQAATTAETLVQVQTAEPVPPRRLNPSVPLDLETITLRCLEKDPARRYESVHALADELARFGRKEPILARPISRRERIWRWCRRNPAVASLATAAVLSLIAVAAVSTVAALRLNAQAERERQLTRRANQEANNARDQRAKADQLADANAKLADKERRERRNAETNATRAAEEAERARRGELYARRQNYAATVNLAHKAWDGGHVARMLELLDSLVPIKDQEDLRGFEWRYLWRLGRPARQPMPPHYEPVRALEFTRRGDRVASACEDGAVRVFEPATGKLLLERMGAVGEVNDAAFSPDGKWLAAGGADGRVRIWDATDGTPARTLTPELTPWAEPGFTLKKGGAANEGYRVQTLAAGGPAQQEGTLRVDDQVHALSLDGTNMTRLDSLPEARINAALFGLPGSDLLLDVSSAGQPQPRRVKLTRRPLALEPTFSSPVTSLEFSADGRWLAAGLRGTRTPGQGIPGQVNVWEVATWNQKTVFSAHFLDLSVGHPGGPNSVNFAPDGESLFTTGNDGLAIRTSTTDGRELVRFKGHTGWVMTAALSPDGKLLATGSVDNTIRIWTVDGGERATIKPQRGNIYGLAFSPDGRTVAAATDEGAVLCPLQAVQLRGIPHAGPLRAVAFSPDGGSLMTGGIDREVRRWNLTEERGYKSLETLFAASLSFSPDRKTLAVGHVAGSITIWDLANGQKTASWTSSGAKIRGVVFSHDGRRLATVGEPRAAFVWNAEEGKIAHELSGHGGAVSATVFSPDDQVVITACCDGKLRFWNPATGRETRPAEELHLHALAVSPDGRSLAAGGIGKSLVLLEIPTWREIGRIDCQADDVTALAFSPDGRTLATGGGDPYGGWRGQTLLWQASDSQHAPALLLRNRGEMAPAAEQFQRAAGQQRLALKSLPGHQVFRRFHRQHLTSLTDLQLARNDHAGAAAAVEAFLNGTQQSDEEFVAAARLFARCRSQAERDASLDEAPRQAAANAYGDHAVELLRGALAGRFATVAGLQRDEQLKSLHSHAGFRGLLETEP